METVHEILRLDELLQDLAQRRAEFAGRPGWEAVDAAYRAAEEERDELITSLSPEDDAWLEVERAGIRHGVSGDYSA
jgi:hypothetical protein